MDAVAVAKKDDVYLWVSGEPHVIREMSDCFTFDVPAAKFHPSYKMGAWDGKIRLLNYKDQTIYAGLLPHIRTFCRERGYILTSEEQADENFSLNIVRCYTKIKCIFLIIVCIECKCYRLIFRASKVSLQGINQILLRNGIIHYS